jgi:hypothetical protein
MLCFQEAFDYIGSNRMVYDMGKGEFPTLVSKINMTNLAQFVEVSQVGMRDATNSLYLHVDPDFYTQSKSTVCSFWEFVIFLLTFLIVWLPFMLSKLNLIFQA